MKTLKDIIFSDIKVNNNDNYLIFNEGGIGKTTQMKEAYLELINSHIDKIVPVFIDCKSLNFKSDYPLLSAILEKYCGNDCMESTHLERLKKLICSETPQRDNYKYIIFVDAINECESNKYKISQDINELLKSPNKKIIVSSRINEDELVSKGFKKLKVKEFTDEQIIAYLNKKGINDNGVNIKLNKLNPSLLKILRIPMFLKLFANTYSDSEKHIFPDIYTTNIVRKADLLQGFLDKILEDKENQHGNKIAPEYLERKFALNLFLPALAFEMSLKSTFAISEKVMTDVIDNKFSYDYFKRLTFSNDRKLFKNIDCNDVLDICKDEFSLITLSNKSYAFSHQVWRDFFCAKFYAICIERDIIDIFDNSISASVRQFIGEIVKNENGKCECDFEKITNLEEAKKSPINTFLQSHNLNSSTPLSTLQTYTLIEIMKTSRNNNITADYSNLDLKNVNFYKCKLRNSTFNNTKIYSHNFIPQGHTNCVTSVAFSQDGTIIVSGDWDNNVRIWNGKTGLQIGKPLKGHTDHVNSVAISPDGTKIVSGSMDETIRVWNAKTGLQIGDPLTGHTNIVTSVAFSQDGKKIVSGSGDETIRVWNAKTGLQIGDPLTGHTNIVTSVAFSQDGKKIVSGSGDETIRIWDVETGLQIGDPLIGHTNIVTSVVFSRDGTKIVSASDDETIRMWNTETRSQIGEPLTGHSIGVTSIAFSPDDKKLVSGSWDNTIRIWDIETGAQIGDPLKGHTDGVTSVAFSQDGTKMVSGSIDRTIRIWDVSTMSLLIDPINSWFFCSKSMAFSPINRMIVSASSEKIIRIFDSKTGIQLDKIMLDNMNEIKSIAISNDCKRIAIGSDYGKICVLNNDTEKIFIKYFQGHILGVNSVAFSPDGTKIVSGSDDETIRIWDVETGLQIGKPLIGHTDYVNSVAFSQDGTKIVSGSGDETIRIWDTETSKQIGDPLQGHTDWVTSVAFSPDGTKIVSGSWDSTIRIWDVETGLQIGKPLTVDFVFMESVSFSQDSTKIVSGGCDGAIYIWNTENNDQIRCTTGEHDFPIMFVAFSEDDITVISGSEDGTVKIWDLENHLYTAIEGAIPVCISNCDFRNANYDSEEKDEFYKTIYSNGGLVKDEFKPKPIPFEY